jgi:hypothetical protein
MRSIVRKRLVALLSLAGLAGTTASATTQADKSSTAADTKQESQVKLHKANQNNSVTKGSQKITPDYTRHKKSQAEAEINSVHQDADVKGGKTLDAGSKDAAKMSKASKENSASADLVGKKQHKTQVHTDALTIKQKTGVQSNQPQPQPDQKAKPETPK